MSESAKNNVISETPVTTKIMVIKNLAHTGYRRAGHAFQEGDNLLSACEFTATQLAQLQADPRLVVAADDLPIASDPHRDPSGVLDEGHVHDVLMTDTIVAAIAQLDPQNSDHFTSSGKPQVDALAAITGHAVSAAQRDAAWTAYQAQQAQE